VSNGKVFANNFSPGFTDGMRCDTDGNVWCSMGWADPKEDGVPDDGLLYPLARRRPAAASPKWPHRDAAPAPRGRRSDGAGGFFLAPARALSSANVRTRPTASRGSRSTEAGLTR